MKPVDHALALAERGIATFPMTRAKTPMKDSHGFNDATIDPVRLREMFSAPGAMLVAIATGAQSGISILDIDRQHDGGPWFSECRDRLPHTWAWRTRSGGLHLAMRHRVGLRTCQIGVVGQGTEIRSNGASAIYWPSAGFPVLCDADPAPWPDWLMPPPRPERLPAPPRVPDDVGIGRLIRFAATAPEGERNGRLYWAGRRLAEYVANGMIGEGEAIALIEATGTAAGLPLPEARCTARSAIRAAS